MQILNGDKFMSIYSVFIYNMEPVVGIHRVLY